ncbi:HIT-like domain-containing protein [Diplogelasinospora grovesii]|uniref:HIT-like domain-containing protein n=1 Tax=Diplogelasinospora grovesii TaxID=303347 RepID=A0AAN6MWI3_9PEZI|nr:HIT-like domain-containing protein [Diplogelasinospora grovesii]
MAPSTYTSSLPPPPPPPPPTSQGNQFDPGVHNVDDDCPFCKITATYAPYDPTNPPQPSSSTGSSSNTSSDPLNPEAGAPNPPTFVVLSTPLLIAFLDIMPLSHGHVLLCPRAHRPKLSDVTSPESRELGYFLRLLSSAVARATGVGDWNVVQNNGAAAAQVVPHMHFHIIPRPELRANGRSKERFTSTMFGRGQREELDEEEAGPLAQSIREAIAQLLQEEEQSKPKL